MPKNLDIGISITCYKRIDYLSYVLQSLFRALEYSQIKQIKLYFSVDYYSNDIPQYIAKLNRYNKSVIINNPSIGCNKNTAQAILFAIRNHDAIIHLEDDTVLSYDAIDYFISTLHMFRNDSEILSIGGYNKTISLNENSIYDIKKHKDFICWGLGLWRSKIDIILNNWIPNADRYNSTESWDTHINQYVYGKHSKYFQIRPAISRIQNIGAKNGTYILGAAINQDMTEDDWHKKYQMSPYTSDDIKIINRNINWTLSE